MKAGSIARTVVVDSIESERKNGSLTTVISCMYVIFVPVFRCSYFWLKFVTIICTFPRHKNFPCDADFSVEQQVFIVLVNNGFHVSGCFCTNENHDIVTL